VFAPQVASRFKGKRIRQLPLAAVAKLLLQSQAPAGTQFTCFTRTNVQKLTHVGRRQRTWPRLSSGWCAKHAALLVAGARGSRMATEGMCLSGSRRSRQQLLL
jgi:hypothetical protein